MNVIYIVEIIHGEYDSYRELAICSFGDEDEAIGYQAKVDQALREQGLSEWNHRKSEFLFEGCTYQVSGLGGVSTNRYTLPYRPSSNS